MVSVIDKPTIRFSTSAADSVGVWTRRVRIIEHLSIILGMRFCYGLAIQ